jgi:hypothetical protein
MSRPIKNREQFFKLVEEGLQQYFDQCDRYWGGILHLTVGVKCGKVGGIIKSENMLSYEGFTLHRVETILKYVLPRFVSRDSVPYAIAAVLDELRMEGAPSNSSQARLLGADKSAVVATDAPFASAPKGEDSDLTEAEPQPKKPRTRGRKKKTEVEPQNTEDHEQGEEDPQA